MKIFSDEKSQKNLFLLCMSSAGENNPKNRKKAMYQELLVLIENNMVEVKPGEDLHAIVNEVHEELFVTPYQAQSNG